MRVWELFPLKSRSSVQSAGGVDRRGFLRAAADGAAATVVTGVVACEADAVELAPRDERRKARYRPNSPEVQDFYRVNGYPPRSGRSSC